MLSTHFWNIFSKSFFGFSKLDIFKNVQKRKNEKSLGKRRFFKHLWRECSENQKNEKSFVTITFLDFGPAFFFCILQMIQKKMPKNAGFPATKNVTYLGFKHRLTVNRVDMMIQKWLHKKCRNGLAAFTVRKC